MTETKLTVRVLTLFPAMFPGPLGTSLAGKALERGDWRLETLDIRDFARDKHRSVDDTPFGGGAGMVMKPDVLSAALTSAQCVEGKQARTFYLSPRGRVFDQMLARSLATEENVILLCGRYEGVDQRVIEAHGLEELSLGDFVLSGGEPAAIAVIDAIVRLLPGVMGNTDSAEEESFGASSGMLEYPHYTRPAVWHGPDGVDRAVPDVLMSGHHADIDAWRREQAEGITKRRRPDLWHRAQRAEPAKKASNNQDQQD